MKSIGQWALALSALCLLWSEPGSAKEVAGASPLDNALEFKFGGYTPRLADESGLSSDPYEDTFNGSMLLFELEMDFQLWQKVGSIAAGLSAGYAEKYGDVTVVGDPAAESEERTGLKVLPLRLLGVYRFDWVAKNIGVPLVPFGKLGLVYMPWWVSKGGKTEEFNGQKARGGKWGYSFHSGLALLLDFFDPRLARDFDTSMGVNHSYFFVEYTRQHVNNFGGEGLNLSSGHWMFGLALEY